MEHWQFKIIIFFATLKSSFNAFSRYLKEEDLRTIERENLRVLKTDKCYYYRARFFLNSALSLASVL